MIQDIPLNKLAPSPDNVRTISPEKASDAALIASIHHAGLMQNLTVTAPAKATGRYRVIAGGRRLAALQHLAGKGDLPKDYPVPCRITREGENITELSLQENLQRVPLHPADQFAAFERMRAEGSNEPEIAAHFGIPRIQVQRMLRLARVAPEIVDAYRDGKLTLDQVQAYAITEDTERQLLVFRGNRNQVPWQIRRELTENRIAADHPKVKSAGGLKAYRRAGGEVLTDLFQNDKYLDAKLIDQLVAKARQRVIAEVEAEGWGFVETSEYFDYGYRQIDPPTDHQPDRAAALLALESRLQFLENTDPDDLETDQIAAHRSEMETVEAEITALEAEIERHAWTPEQRAQYGAVVCWPGGDIQVMRGVTRPVGRDGPASTTNEGKKTDTRPPAEQLPAAVEADLAEYRMQAVRIGMSQAPDAAFLLVAFHFCDRLAALGTGRYTEQILGVGTTYTAPPYVATAKAAVWLDPAVGGLPMAWADFDSVTERFEAFGALPANQVHQLFAIAVGRFISPAMFAKVAGTLAGLIFEYGQTIPLRDVFEPNVEYFKRLKKTTLIAIGEAWEGDAWAKEWRTAKAGPLAEELARLAALPERADWVPETMLKDLPRTDFPKRARPTSAN